MTPSKMSKAIMDLQEEKYLDSLSAEFLATFCRILFENGEFCCISDQQQGPPHIPCVKEYSPRGDYEHTPTCRCCQSRMFREFLGRCCEKLASQDGLPEFNKSHLSRARIRDRTYAYLKLGSKIQFKIDRHPGAFRPEWKGGYDGLVVTQTWEFDFDKLTLTLLGEK